MIGMPGNIPRGGPRSSSSTRIMPTSGNPEQGMRLLQYPAAPRNRGRWIVALEKAAGSVPVGRLPDIRALQNDRVPRTTARCLISAIQTTV
jgi:hypothetical protein